MREKLITIVIGVLGTTFKGLERGLEELEIGRQEQLDHSSVKIDQKTEKSPWDLIWLAVAQTPVKDH